MPLSDVKVADRVMCGGVVCEVLRIDRPVSAPARVLVAELMDVDGDGRPYGVRSWASQDELDPVVDLTVEAIADVAVEAEAEAEAGSIADEWGDELPDNVVDLLEAADVKPSDVPELGATGLMEFKGIGKATAAKILAAAKG